MPRCWPDWKLRGTGAITNNAARPGVTAALQAMSHGLGDKPFYSGAHLSLADIAVGVALGYLDFRFPDINWRESHANLHKLYDKLMLRPSFIDTTPF